MSVFLSPLILKPVLEVLANAIGNKNKEKKRVGKKEIKLCTIYIVNIMYIEYLKLIHKLLEFIDTKSILKINILATKILK